VAAALIRELPSAQHERHSPVHWESWLIRALLVAGLAYQLVRHDFGGATTFAEGIVVSLVPLAIQRFSHTHVPRVVELLFMLIIAVQFPSESFKLFEHFYYWDKIVHPTEIFLATFMGALLLLGYIDTYELRMSRELAAAVSMLFGASLGTLWEFFEFLSDWFGNTDLQKSNADTMTDIFANDAGAFVATLLALWLYHHWTSPRLREELGHLAHWLTEWPGKQFRRHGGLIGTVFVLIILGICAAAWFVDRNPPSLPSGLTQGQPRTWSLASLSLAPSGAGTTVSLGGGAGVSVLLGDWQADNKGEEGICRVNVEHPKPGSEKPGLIALAPGSAYGLDSSTFAVSARYFEQRPTIVEGSQMTAGIAFGMRDAKDFYLLETSALHDFVRLDHFIHGRRRDLREMRVRTHGNEWHELQVRVQGDRASALLDGKQIFEQTRLTETSGEIGLWARASATACFSQATVA
jgi:hypothetical protein